MPEQPFRIGFVPGVMPGRWLDRWREREPHPALDSFQVSPDAQRAVLDDGRADMCFVRLPIDRDGLHLVRLYDEQIVVVLSVDHVLSLLEEVTASDLEGELVQVGEPHAARIAFEAVAAGTGVLVVPRSVARLHHRKDLTTRPLQDAEPSTVALAWLERRDDERAQAFVGIVRGRTAQSSRGPEVEGTSPGKRSRRR